MNITEASLPRLREQDLRETAAGSGAKKLPAVLLQIQAGGIGQCKGIYNNKNNRARRYDAEPMIPKGMNMALRFVSDRHNRNRKTNRFVRKIEICLFNFL